MKKLELVFITMVLCSVIGIAKAQTLASPLEVQFQLEATMDDEMMSEGTGDLDPMILEDPAMMDMPEMENSTSEINVTYTKASVHIMLADSTIFHKIHFTLGSSQGGNDLMEGYIVYDDYTHENITYQREGNDILLTFGRFENLFVLFGSLYLEDENGNTSEIIFNQAQL